MTQKKSTETKVKTREEKQEFYETCARILGIDHEYRDPVRRTRWTNRRLGNGRFPEFGLVQCFGSTQRVVSRHGTKVFESYEEVYEYLHKVVDKSKTTV